MSKNIKTALISFGFVILCIISYIVYAVDGFDKLYEFFGISNKYPYNFVRFIDVGQGDCALIHSNGKYVLIDAGCNNDNGIALSTKLRDYNVKSIECIIVTHDDDDHAGGVYKVLEDFDVKAIVCSKYSYTDKEEIVYKAIDLAEQKGTAVLSVDSGDKLFFGDAEFKFLWIDEKSSSGNNRSVVTRVSMDGKVFFFSGDINSSVEERMLEAGIDVKCDILKAAHHGSAWSSSEEFLDKARPTYCVVSCSKDNMYGFPSEPFLSRISERDIILYKTYESGDITFNTTDLTVYTKK